MPRRRKMYKREGYHAVVYTRVSSRGQSLDGISLDAQAERIRAYCEFKGLQIIETIEEAGVSAFKPFGERLGGAKVLQALESGQAEHVVAVKLDRLFRNVSDCLTVVTDWHYAGITLHLTDLGGQAFDSGSAIGKLFLTMLAALAEWERSIISERTREALHHKERLGESVGRPPYGWSWDTDAHVLVPVEAEQKIIERILDLWASGLTMRGISDLLNEEGIPTKGKKRWTADTVIKLVHKHER